MTPISLGDGFAPDVTFHEGLCYIAWGTKAQALQLAVYTPAGIPISHETIPDGFFSSFPRLGAGLLVYRANITFEPVALNLVSGQVTNFPGREAGGNWPVVVENSQFIAWQEGPFLSYRVFVGGIDGTAAPTEFFGAPDGLEAVFTNGVRRRNEIIHVDPPTGTYSQRAGDLWVGQHNNGGLNLHLDGDMVRWIPGNLTDNDHPDPRVAFDGLDTYAVCCWGKAGVQLFLLKRADIRGLLPSPADEPPSPPPPPPPPPPPMATIFTESQFAAFKERRTLYPTPMSPAQNGALLNWAAWTFGLKLFAKPGGTNCPQPRTGILISRDVLLNVGKSAYADVIQDAEGAGVVVNADLAPGDMTNQVEPVQPDGVPDPPPPPPPPSDHEQRIAALENSQRALASQVASLTVRMLDLEDDVATLTNGIPELAKRVTALEQRKYRVNGQTGSSIAHRHAVTLPVEIVP